MINSTDLRLLLSEVIWLEPEHFQHAREMSKRVTDEAHQWQSYINSLALLGFERWLSERVQNESINRDTNIIETVCNLWLGEFKFCLIATENLLDEVVNVPQNIIDESEKAAHLYVVLEVLEEEEQVIIRGILRYDQLVNYRSQVNSQSIQGGYYQLPLSLFDIEPNHLLFYNRFLSPTSIPLPVASTQTSSVPFLTSLQKNRTKLSQWLEGIFEEGWQAIDTLIKPEANLAFSIRNTEEGTKRAKLIDMGMQFGDETVAMLVNITKEAEEKLGILIQLHPTGGERYLPHNLKLTLLSKTGKTLQEVTSRDQDNYIQLKPFKGEEGKRFCIQVSCASVRIREDFEL
ncbi:MAG: DUF1822 family protein [Stigonema ocellatum SAG 48.90 = DSM 106950]|nr:DUF1822 family protein [Stigonema ocellatum SAG 48.90 = DSM 106950]